VGAVHREPGSGENSQLSPDNWDYFPFLSNKESELTAIFNDFQSLAAILGRGERRKIA
jgi:hypothetical protein